MTVDMAMYENSKKAAQLASQAGGGNVDDQINLDVHAINDLQAVGLTLVFGGLDLHV